MGLAKAKLDRGDREDDANKSGTIKKRHHLDEPICVASRRSRPESGTGVALGSSFDDTFQAFTPALSGEKRAQKASRATEQDRSEPGHRPDAAQEHATERRPLF